MLPVRIERYYYWEDRIKQEEDLRREEMLSEEERIAKRREENEEFFRMLATGWQPAREYQRVFNQIKARKFQQLAECAMIFAKHNQLNIAVQREKEGKIELEGDFIQVGDGLLPGDKYFLADLIASSDQFSITEKQETFILECSFRLHDIVPAD